MQGGFLRTGAAAATMPFQPAYGVPFGASPLPRRPATGQDKSFVCTYEGCDSAYYFSHDLRRHERQKHGRKTKRKSTGPMLGDQTIGEPSFINDEAQYLQDQNQNELDQDQTNLSYMDGPGAKGYGSDEDGKNSASSVLST